MRRREAFEDLYRLHAPAAWRVAWVVLRNRDDAADAVSEAFARLYAAGVPPEADFRSYLLAAVRNASIDVLRKSRRVELTDTVELTDGGEPPGAGAPAVPTDPAVVGENRAYMAQAFAELPERWRSALWLIDVEELSTHDAGSILGVAPNTAAQLASRARGRIRQQFLQAHVANHVRPECRRAVAALGAHAAGTLPPGRRARIDDHLAVCGDCATRRADLEDLRVALRAVPPPLPLALLDWTAPRQRGSLLAVLEQLQAAPSTAAAQVVAHASPAVSAAGERLVAAATATVLVASMSVAALKGGDPAPPQDGGGAPSVVAAALPPVPGTGAVAVPLGVGGRSPAIVAAALGAPNGAADPTLAKAVPAILGATVPLVGGSAAALAPATAGATSPVAPLTGALPGVTLPGLALPSPGNQGLPLPVNPVPAVAPLVGGLLPAVTAPTASLPVGDVAGSVLPDGSPAVTLPPGSGSPIGTATLAPGTGLRLDEAPAPVPAPAVPAAGDAVPAAQGVVGGVVETVADAPAALPGVGAALPATGGALGEALPVPGGVLGG